VCQSMIPIQYKGSSLAHPDSLNGQTCNMFDTIVKEAGIQAE